MHVYVYTRRASPHHIWMNCLVFVRDCVASGEEGEDEEGEEDDEEEEDLLYNSEDSDKVGLADLPVSVMVCAALVD